MVEALTKVDSVTDSKHLFKVTYNGTRITLTVAVPVSSLSSNLNIFLFARVFSKATTQRNSEKKLNLNVQEIFK